VRRLSVKIGEPGHTTLWELLALLLAARLWLANSRRFRTVQVRSDSLGTLRVAVKLASRSANLNFIAQELALHMAAHDFEFKIAAAYTRYNSERCPRRFVATVRNATKGHFPVLVRRQ
jgi:hypothetical protein